MNDRPAMLRDWSPDDGAWYAAQLADPQIQRFTSERPSTTADDFRRALARLRSRADQAGFAIVDAASGELAGNIAAHRSDGDRADVSYWVAPGFRRRGLASDALTQMCAWIGAHWHVQEIVLWTHADNTASQRAAEKAGFRYRPERDEILTVGTQEWPARWYRLSPEHIDPEHPRNGPGHSR
jgi:[ribosomal protein S5]-alanine N-acetyltransferase